MHFGYEFHLGVRDRLQNDFQIRRDRRREASGYLSSKASHVAQFVVPCLFPDRGDNILAKHNMLSAVNLRLNFNLLITVSRKIALLGSINFLDCLVAFGTAFLQRCVIRASRGTCRFEMAAAAGS